MLPQTISLSIVSDVRFECDGKQCTVQKYFYDQHKRVLKYPDLPCLHMAAKNNTVYIPMEVRHILFLVCTCTINCDIALHSTSTKLFS